MASKIDGFRFAEKFTEILNGVAGTIGDAIDTIFTIIRVIYWYAPEIIAPILWSLPGIIVNFVLNVATAGIFTLIYIAEKIRTMQLQFYSFTAKRLTKTVTDLLKYDDWDSEAFTTYASFEKRFNTYDDKIKRRFRKLLMVASNDAVLTIIKEIFNKKKPGQGLTVKDILAYIPKYLHKEIDKKRKYKKNRDYASFALMHKRYDKVPLTQEEQEQEEFANIKSVWERLGITIIKELKNISGIAWDGAVIYSFWFWINVAGNAIFFKPEKTDGGLTDNTDTIKYLPFVNLGLYLVHRFVSFIRAIRDAIKPPRPRQYRFIDDKAEREKVQYDGLTAKQKESLHIIYFIKQYVKIYKLKNDLQHQDLIRKLKNHLKHGLRVTKVDDFTKGNEAKLEAKQQAIKDRIDQQLQDIPLPTVGEIALSTKRRILQKDSYFSGVKSKMLAHGIGHGMFIFCVYCMFTWFLSVVIPNAMAATITFSLGIVTLSGPTFILVGSLIAAGMGLLIGIKAAFDTYNTHKKMAAQFDTPEVQKALEALAKSEAESEKARARFYLAEMAKQGALNNQYNAQTEEQRKLSTLSQKEWERKLPLFNQVNFMTYKRFRETLSFKTTLKTLLKKAGKRVIQFMMGGVTGSFSPRVVKPFFATIGITAVAGVSLGTLFTINAPLAAVLTAILLLSVVFMGAVRVWRYHLKRIEDEQNKFLEALIPPAGSNQLSLQYLVNKQTKACNHLSEHAIAETAHIELAADLIDPHRIKRGIELPTKKPNPLQLLMQRPAPTLADKVSKTLASITTPITTVMDGISNIVTPNAYPKPKPGSIKTGTKYNQSGFYSPIDASTPDSISTPTRPRRLSITASD